MTGKTRIQCLTHNYVQVVEWDNDAPGFTDEGVDEAKNAHEDRQPGHAAVCDWEIYDDLTGRMIGSS